MATVSAERLAARLVKGENVPAILLVGPDAYLRESTREQIIETVVDPASRSWALEHYSAAQDELATVLGRARMMPMLAPRQVIVYSDLEAMEPPAESKKSDESKKDDTLEILREYLASPPAFTVLVLEAAKLDLRTRLSKLLLEAAAVVEARLPDDPRERLQIATRLTKQMVVQLKGAIENSAAEELADLCNGDLSTIHSEAEKLVTYAGPGRTIGLADVEALVVAEKRYSVWELADVLATGQVARALQFIDKLLRDGEQPPALVGAMAWMFRKLLEAKDLGRGVSAGQAAGRLGMRLDAAEMAVRQAQRISRGQLVRGLQALYEADSRLKSAAKDDRAIMEFLVAQLAGSREPAARGA
jgi:DNA polymerase III subunit delta